MKYSFRSQAGHQGIPSDMRLAIYSKYTLTEVVLSAVLVQLFGICFQEHFRDSALSLCCFI